MSALSAVSNSKSMYSEQKNRLTKGQISLVRQIAAQITKVNPWENSRTKLSILFPAVPSNKHLASITDFILTLGWDPPDETVFLLTMKLALHTHTIWLNLKYHVTWSYTIYRTPLVQLHPQQMCPGTHGENSLICSEMVNFAIRWPLR